MLSPIDLDTNKCKMKALNETTTTEKLVSNKPLLTKLTEQKPFLDKLYADKYFSKKSNQQKHAD